MPRTPKKEVTESKLTATPDGPAWVLMLKCGHSARSEAEHIRTYDRGKKREIVIGVSLPPNEFACNLCPQARPLNLCPNTRAALRNRGVIE